MDAAQWPKALVYDFHKEIGHVNNPSGGSCDIPGSNSPSSHSKQDKKKHTKPNKDQALNCPRCNSTNTKFCYYNNYNPTQPRYLCKACRRYWTHGGTLRNVPVGGSSRKKNRPSSSLAPNSLSNNSKLFLDLNPKPTTMLANFSSSSVPLNPTRSFMHEINNHDLNMGLYYANAHHHHFLPIPQNFELSASQGGLSSYHVPMSETNTRLLYPSSGFHFQDIIKPTLNLSMDGGLGGGAGSRATPPYPFGELKQDSTTSSAENVMDQTNGDTRDHSNNGVVYWNNNGLYN